ncbi:MAG: chorismate mutase [Lagierella massiliensis]|nr:chorismate mutase [Lagierella massiliensis]
MNRLNELRSEIDFIDFEINKLFIKRLEIVEQIRLEKRKLNMDILDTNREIEIYKQLKLNSKKKNFKYSKDLFENILRISKSYQEEI